MGYRPSVIGHRPSALGHRPSALGRRPPAIRYIVLISIFYLTLGLARVFAAPPEVTQTGGTIDSLVTDLVQKLSAALPLQSRAGSDMALVVNSTDDLAISAELLAVISRQTTTRLTRLQLRSVKPIRSSALTPQALRRQLRANGYEYLVATSVSVVKGYLHLRAEVFVLSGSYWQDLLDPPPTVLSHAHSSHRIDAEIQAFSPGKTTNKVNFALHRYRKSYAPILALAQGDLDGDGQLELILLHRESVSILTYRGKGSGFVTRATLSLGGDLAHIASRRVFGALAVNDIDGDGKAEIFARTSELATTRRLNWAPKVRGNLKTPYGFPLTFWSTAAKSPILFNVPATIGMDHFASDQLRGTAKGTKSIALPTTFPPLFYTMKSMQLASKSGPQRFMGVVDTGGRFHLFDHTLNAELLSLAGSGIAFDLLDLDDNGQPELVTSAVNENGDADRLTISRVKGLRQLIPLWRSGPLPGNLSALAHGDLDGDGKQELIGAVDTAAGKSELVVFN